MLLVLKEQKVIITNLVGQNFIIYAKLRVDNLWFFFCCVILELEFEIKNESPAVFLKN